MISDNIVSIDMCYKGLKYKISDDEDDTSCTKQRSIINFGFYDQDRILDQEI